MRITTKRLEKADDTYVRLRSDLERMINCEVNMIGPIRLAPRVCNAEDDYVCSISVNGYVGTCNRFGVFKFTVALNRLRTRTLLDILKAISGHCYRLEA